MATGPSVEKAPTRTFTESTVADRSFPSTTAGFPAPTPLSSNPQTLVLLSDIYPFPVVTATAISNATEFVLSQSIPITNVSSVMVPQGYFFHVHVIPWVSHAIPGLVLESIAASASVASGGAKISAGTGNFSGGATYSGFSASVTARFWNASGSTIAAGKSITPVVFVIIEYSSVS
jgi:hypothetical protein